MIGATTGLAVGAASAALPPFELQVREQDPTSVTIAWGDEDYDSGAESLVEVTWGETTYEQTTTGTSITLDRLPIAPETEYSVRVCKGMAVWSLPKTVTTGEASTLAPASVDVDTRTRTSLTLSWPAVEAATGYGVALAPIREGVVRPAVVRRECADTTTTLSELTPGRSYLAHVWSESAGGPGGTAAAVVQTAGDARAPRAPTVWVTDRTPDSITLAWPPAFDPGTAGVDRYRVEWQPLYPPPGTLVQPRRETVPADQRSVTIGVRPRDAADMDQGRAYSVSVSAIDANGNVSESTTQQVYAARDRPGDVSCALGRAPPPDIQAIAIREGPDGGVVHVRGRAAIPAARDLFVDAMSIETGPVGATLDTRPASHDLPAAEGYWLSAQFGSVPDAIEVTAPNGDDATASVSVEPEVETGVPVRVEPSADFVLAGEPIRATVRAVGLPASPVELTGTVDLSGSGAARIEAVESGADADELEVSIEADGQRASVELTVADAPNPADLLAIDLTGSDPGSVTVDCSVSTLTRTDDGTAIGPDSQPAVTRPATVRVAPVTTLTGDARPQDLDGDGRFEDITGNGRVDFPDVNALFGGSDRPLVSEQTHAFDFNDDGSVGIQDVLALFESV
ncbi:fibronectin type III domain-containing protein [Halococcoides cellulosivorans]|uniref:fibronectin type III domain-containing protein n=1 Tax=Halococcoides cellulosivorans TaxID=1679096 RepID=UPI00131F1705|nr:fibronectin type III domain-containing protein [Halococcoides cellulosivorans]